jgi:cytochrome P450
LRGFEPMRPDLIIDPFPLLAEARREAPVFYVRELNEWCVTRYADIEEVLRDTDAYSSAEFINLPPFPPEVAESLPNGHPLEGTLVTIDPPAHTRIRKAIQKGFSPRQAEAQADEVRSLANALIDDFVDQGQTDLVTAYCTQIPLRVIGLVLGISIDDVAQLHRWATEGLILVSYPWLLSAAELLEYGRDQIELDRYVRELVEERRRNPRGEDDLVTRMIFAAGDDGQPALANQEIVGVVSAAIVAGGDTVATTLGHCVQFLLSDHTRWEQIAADSKLIPNALEETLRMHAGVRGARRTTTRDCVLNGVQLAKGEVLFVHMASGSRDEAVFTDPERFDLRRENAKQHLGFGKWKHFCIGAPLARMEMRVAIETLAERIPGLRLVPGHSIEYGLSLHVLSLIRGLVVEWDG